MNTRTIALPMLCLLLLPAPSFSQQAASNSPQSNPLQDSPAVRDAWRKAYKDFKPPAAVAARIEELKNREREVRDLWSAGELSQRDLSIEIERNQIHRHLLLCLALVAGEGGETPELIVVRANKDEIRKVFPSGKFPTDPLQRKPSADWFDTLLDASILLTEGSPSSPRQLAESSRFTRLH